VTKSDGLRSFVPTRTYLLHSEKRPCRVLLLLFRTPAGLLSTRRVTAEARGVLAANLPRGQSKNVQSCTGAGGRSNPMASFQCFSPG